MAGLSLGHRTTELYALNINNKDEERMINIYRASS